MSINFYYCKGDGFHAVIEERNEKFATEYFVYLMNELLEPEKGIIVKDVTCEAVNVYNYKAAQQSAQADEVTGCAHRTPRVVGDGLFACDDCGKTLRR